MTRHFTHHICGLTRHFTHRWHVISPTATNHKLLILIRNTYTFYYVTRARYLTYIYLTACIPLHLWIALQRNTKISPPPGGQTRRLTAPRTPVRGRLRLPCPPVARLRRSTARTRPLRGSCTPPALRLPPSPSNQEKNKLLRLDAWPDQPGLFSLTTALAAVLFGASRCWPVGDCRVIPARVE